MGKWIAYYAPADSNYETKRGLESEDAAWAYIATQLCEHCKQEYTHRASHDLDENGEPYPIEHPSDTSCGAEWFVLKEEDFDNAEGFDGILEAAGWGKVENKPDGN